MRCAPGDCAYFPAASGKSLTSPKAARAVIIEKSYEPLAGSAAPAFFAGRETNIPPEALNGDPSLEVRAMVPPDASFDFAVNTMTYLPGASLPMVEMHVMEHGLLMLEGGGIYRLNDHWYPVAAGDFPSGSRLGVLSRSGSLAGQGRVPAEISPASIKIGIAARQATK